MMINKFRSKKFLSIFLVFLLFIGMVFINIPVTYYTSRADSISTSSVNSMYLSPEILQYVDGAVEEGVGTFDFFDTTYGSDNDIIYDEYLILYDLEFNELNGGYIYSLNMKLLDSVTFYPDYETSFGIYTDSYFDYSSISLEYQGMSGKPSGIYNLFEYFCQPSFLDTSDYSMLYGGFYYFDSSYVFNNNNPFAVGAFLSNGSVWFDDYSVPLSDYFGSISSITMEQIQPYISMKFITLSAVVNYAVSQGYNIGLNQSTFDIYGSLTDATADVEFVFKSYDDGSEIEITLTDLPVTFRNGFVTFDNLSIFEEVDIVNGEVLTNGIEYYWSSGQLYLNINYPMYYDSPLYRINGGDIFEVGLHIYTNSYSGWLSSEPDSTGLLSVPNPTGFVDIINIPAGRGFDSVQSFIIQDTSIKSSFDYNKGYQNGYDIGYGSGYDFGFGDGSRYGYTNGYEDGANGSNAFLALISSVIDVPVQTFINLFDINILGVNLKNFFLSLLGICLVLSLVKFFLSLGGLNA